MTYMGLLVMMYKRTKNITRSLFMYKDPLIENSLDEYELDIIFKGCVK